MKMSWDEAMRVAVQEAQAHLGRTAPNPAVGAVVLSESGEVIGVGAHVQAGMPHAEVLALKDARERFPSFSPHTLVVTLEPCNHQGRTGPCTEVILQSGVKQVILGQRDPNPRVQGGGIEKLQSRGVKVVMGVEDHLTQKLLESFFHHAKTGKPWVTVKTAHQPDGSMIPPQGQKTFTSPASLVFAHELRKRANAIITGSGTVLADSPFFTVREVEDHPNLRRRLVVLDRRRRVSTRWIREAEERGFAVWVPDAHWSIPDVLVELGRQGCLEVLVEAGPTVAGVFEKNRWVNRAYRIWADPAGDRIEQVDF